MVKKYNLNVLDKKAFLETSIIRLEQLSKQQKETAKEISSVKKDILEILDKKLSYSFANEVNRYDLVIVKETSTIIDNDRLKKDKLYDFYKTKPRKQTKYHITKGDV
jgi:ATP:corrinoid adenosyltransferase